MNHSPDWRKVAFLAFAIAFSLVFAWAGQPLIHGNQSAIDVIVTVFSILAGFLVAIIAIIGDPASIPKGSWRVAEIKAPSIDERINKQKWLFTGYLITLGLIFASLLAAKVNTKLSAVLEHIYLFMSSVAFIYSLKLPGFLSRIQRERVSDEIEARRRQAIPSLDEHEQ
jgi:Na+/H+ antiporter NhaB